MANIRTLKLNLLGDVSSFNKSMKGAAKETDSFGKQVAKNMKVAATAAAGLAIAFGVSAVKAAIADQKSQKQLQVALKNTTKATTTQIKATEKWITAQQLAYGIADDELRPALARLVRVTGDVSKAQDLLSLAIDVSAGSGKSLESVTNAISRAQQGNLAGLKKLGVPLSETIIKNKDLAAALKITEDRFKDAAAQGADTLAGKMAIFNQTIGEAKEQIGGAILDALQPLAEEWLPKISSGVQGFVDGLTGVKKKGDPAYESVKKWGQETRDIVNWLGDHLYIVKGFATAVAAIWVTSKINAAVVTITTSIGLISAAYAKLAGTAAAAAEAQTASNIAAAGGVGGVGIASKIGGLLRLAPLAGLAWASKGSFKDPKTDADWAQYIVGQMKATKGWSDAEAQAYGKRMGYAGFGGAKALGGGVLRGRSYLVGEHGPEIFTPMGGGTITPNSRINGGGHTFILNGIVDAESARRTIERVLQQSSIRTGAVNINGSLI